VFSFNFCFRPKTKNRTRRLRIRRRGIRGLVRLTTTPDNKVPGKILSLKCRWANKPIIAGFYFISHPPAISGGGKKNIGTVVHP
jgi:hypothetical protein